MASFIYFDVGGVACLDFSFGNKWIELISELGIPPEKHAAFFELWGKYSDRLCVDRDVETMLAVLGQNFSLQIPQNYSLLKGFTNRFEQNTSIWPVVAEARQKARIGLLTNMYVGMFAAIQQRDLLPPAQWDVVVDSSVERLQKPDPNIFTLAEQKTGVAASDIFFIDNVKENIESAAALGWQTFLYDNAHPEQSSSALQSALSKVL